MVLGLVGSVRATERGKKGDIRRERERAWEKQDIEREKERVCRRMRDFTQPFFG